MTLQGEFKTLFAIAASGFISREKKKMWNKNESTFLTQIWIKVTFNMQTAIKFFSAPLPKNKPSKHTHTAHNFPQTHVHFPRLFRKRFSRVTNNVKPPLRTTLRGKKSDFPFFHPGARSSPPPGWASATCVSISFPFQFSMFMVLRGEESAWSRWRKIHDFPRCSAAARRENRQKHPCFISAIVSRGWMCVWKDREPKIIFK